MARKRKKKWMFPRRRKASKKRKSSRKKSKGLLGLGLKPEIENPLLGLGYGAVRGKAASIVVPYAQQIPYVGGIVGKYGDEVAMGLAAWGLGKLKPGLKKYTNKILLCEGFSAGKQNFGNW